MSKLICIYPKDKTTDFLLPIYKQLESLSDFVGYRFDTNNSSKTKNLHEELLQIAENNFIIFLGHGSSNKLYGSVDENGEKLTLFDKKNSECIKKAFFVGVACRSTDFADKHLSNYVGFGDITSDYSEVLAERNIGDPHYLEWASEEDIINFQNEFVGAIVDALKLSGCSDLCSLYRMVKLSFNKRIASLLINRPLQNSRQIADMLYDINNVISIHSSL
ncbi:MAG: hypothetical protein IJ534_05455 [Bacteroidaceae bacterium]|nr:hypothetical protein [Bacteroidaceae bacterium]